MANFDYHIIDAIYLARRACGCGPDCELRLSPEPTGDTLLIHIANNGSVSEHLRRRYAPTSLDEEMHVWLRSLHPQTPDEWAIMRGET